MKLFLILALALTAAAPAPIEPKRIAADVRKLSSDEFAGRGPGEPGEAKTIEFLSRSFAAIGLEPAGESGKWTQDVPLIRLDRLPGAQMSLTVGRNTRSLQLGPQATLSLRNAGSFAVKDAPLIFAGWGVVDPSRGWNAYDGIDMRGKIAVVLANDPDFEAERDLGFGGRALTIAGRTGTKVAAAARAGASGVLVIHEEAALSWPYSQAGSGDLLPAFSFAPLQASALGFTSIVRQDVAEGVLRQLGFSLQALKVRARNAGFRAFPLGSTRLSVSGSNKATPIISRNVIAKIRGSARPAEQVLYGAHWDANGHDGGPDATGDVIRNGAIDNAIGTAELLEIARAFKAGPPPARTVLFAAWTAEEKGLLGSEYYAAHPLFPLATTAAVINLDPHVALPAARNLELIGPGQTDLEGDLRSVAAGAGLRVDPEPSPGAGWYFRSDHYPFAQRGVPSLAFRGGRDLIAGGLPEGDRVVKSYNRACYHQPCDEVDPSWTFAGTAQEARAAFDVGLKVANSSAWPDWLASSPYRAIRAESSVQRVSPKRQ